MPVTFFFQVLKNSSGVLYEAFNFDVVEPYFFKAKAIYSKLPDMYRQIAALQREIEALKEKING